MEETRGPLEVPVCIFCGDLGDTSKDFKEVERFVKEVIQKEGKEVLKEEDLEAVRGLPVCEKCGEVMRGTVEKKRGVEETEGKVKELRKLLEEETKKLEGLLKEYREEMKRMEGILKKSEGKEVEEMLKKKRTVRGDKIEEDVGGEGQKKEVKEATEEEIDYWAAVNNLRELILRVVRNLDDKPDGDNRRKSPRLKKKSKQRCLQSGPVQDPMMPLLHCTVKMEGDEELEGILPRRKRALFIPDFNMEQLIKEEPVEEDDPLKTPEDMIAMDGETALVQGIVVAPEPEVDDDGFEPEVITELIVSGGQGHQGRLRRTRSDGGDVEVDADDLEENEEDYMDTSDDDFLLDEGEEDLGSESESSTSSEETTEEDDCDDEEEYGRKKGKRKGKPEKVAKERKTNPNSKSSRKATYNRILSTLNFSSMSPLKRKLIQRVLHKKYRRPTRKPKTPGKEHVDDPRLSHFLEYDASTDTLSLDSIPIHIHEETTADLEPTLTLVCSLCSFQACPASNSRHPVDSFIYNHIAGQHLNLFQCIQCGSNLGGYKQYSDHVLGHRMGFACDVCGRPLGGAQALARHKWSHLNPQETADLVSKGLKDPREKKEPTKLYSCTTCHKIFPQRCQLRKHEKVHSQHRERITCDVCGKLFLPSGFISHKRYYCFPEGMEQPRISCPLCPKVFKNKQFMQVHMDRAHNTERNHKCPTCGKGFKTKKDLMTHEETHTTERAFSCKKGCGRTYKTRKNCNAHEKRCDGRGGVLIQRFLDAGEERPFGCRKGCGRAYKTRRTLRGHEKTCNGSPFVGELGGGGGIGVEPVSTMTVLGAALQASMDMDGIIVGGGGGGTGTIVGSVPEVGHTETVETKIEFS